MEPGKGGSLLWHLWGTRWSLKQEVSTSQPEKPCVSFYQLYQPVDTHTDPLALLTWCQLIFFSSPCHHSSQTTSTHPHQCWGHHTPTHKTGTLLSHGNSQFYSGLSLNEKCICSAKGNKFFYNLQVTPANACFF